MYSVVVLALSSFSPVLLRPPGRPMKDQHQETYKSEFVRCGRPTGRPLHVKELSLPGVSFVWNESSFYGPLPAPCFLCALIVLCFCFTLWSRVCALLPVYDVAASPRRAPKSLALQLHLSPSTTLLQVNNQYLGIAT